MCSGKYVKARAGMKRFTIFINCELVKLLVNFIKLLRDYLDKGYWRESSILPNKSHSPFVMKLEMSPPASSCS